MDLMSEQPQASTFPHVYANMANFGTTFWDFTCHFGQMVKRGEQEEFAPKVSVTLPWVQAKALSVFLQLNIFAYEKQYGKIDLPPQFLPFLPPPDPETSNAIVQAQWEELQKKLGQILATMEDLNPS
jgi:hypothetical protein